jgi:hypothetical protein
MLLSLRQTPAMKIIYKIILLIFFLSSLTKNSYAQYPFYGFELSNYEVGDTLEYFREIQYGWDPGDMPCNYQDLYVITGKATDAKGDSEMYQFWHIDFEYCPYYYSGNSNGVFQLVINNDTVYNNDNNLLGYQLSKFDTSGSLGGNIDSNYVVYDTINGLKRLKLGINSLAGTMGYEVIQNIGLIDYGQTTECCGFNNGQLIYAHLAHYGIFGTYEYISDGVSNSVHPQTNISIRYDNGGNALLFYSSNENVVQPIVVVYDLLGRKVETQPINTGANLINSPNLAAGIYLYRVSSEENMLGQGKLLLLENNLH